MIFSTFLYSYTDSLTSRVYEKLISHWRAQWKSTNAIIVITELLFNLTLNFVGFFFFFLNVTEIRRYQKMIMGLRGQLWLRERRVSAWPSHTQAGRFQGHPRGALTPSCLPFTNSNNNIPNMTLYKVISIYLFTISLK